MDIKCTRLVDDKCIRLVDKKCVKLVDGKCVRLVVFCSFGFLLGKFPSELIAEGFSHLFHIRQLAVITDETHTDILFGAFTGLSELSI